MTKEEILQLIGILGGWTIVITAIIAYIFQRIAEKINIKWQENSQVKIEKFKGELTRKNELINNVLSFQNSNFSVSQEKRLNAIDKIWDNLNYCKNKIPSSLSFVFNVLTEEEIESFLQSKNKSKEVEHMINELYKFNKYQYFNEIHNYSDDLKSIRPYAGEDLWFSYETYNAFLGRLVYKIHEDVQTQNKLTHWHNDSSIMSILNNYLSEKEINYLNKNKLTSLRTVINLLDTKILDQMNSIISGKLASENALDRALKLEKLR